MRKSWLTLLASQTGKGTPSGSTPTSAAAWSCEEDGTPWGYSKNRGTDMAEQQGKSWFDSGTFADNHKKVWSVHDWMSGVMMKQTQAEGGE